MTRLLTVVEAWESFDWAKDIRLPAGAPRLAGAAVAARCEEAWQEACGRRANAARDEYAAHRRSGLTPRDALRRMDLEPEDAA